MKETKSSDAWVRGHVGGAHNSTKLQIRHAKYSYIINVKYWDVQ